MTNETENVMMDLQLRVDTEALEAVAGIASGRGLDKPEGDDPEDIAQLVADFVVILAMTARLAGIEDYSKIIKASAEHGERMAVFLREKKPAA